MAYRADGAVKWRYADPDSASFAGPTTVTMGGVVYAAGRLRGSGWRVYALRDAGASAELLWTFEPGGPAPGSVSATVGPDGTVYVSAWGGHTVWQQ